MELSLDQPGNYLRVRQVADDHIVVETKTLRRSFLLVPDRLVEDWPVEQAAQLQAEHAQVILELEPQVVLLGSGPRQVFPPAEFTAALLRHGVGVEVMNNAAAARTFGLLAAEGRRVVAAFIL